MKRLLVLLGTVLLVPALLSQEPQPGQARQWEHQRSDVAVNPRIRFGNLDNGLRYAWMANKEPDQRCYVRLHVRVGSLNEEDDQRGLAHFLEHMAFNGSKHFPAGTLVEWFQRHGMDFGADTNASTDFEATIYQLDLPTSDAATLREGLQVMRDFADGALLEADQIASEKGVVDAEQRERDSASFRAAIEMLERRFRGSRIPLRIPIGLAEIRSQFTSQKVRDFYRKWYRPENLTLIIVGDLEDWDPTAHIREFFSDMKAPKKPLPKRADLGYPKFEERFIAVHEKEIPTVRSSLGKVRPWVDEPDTRQTRVKYLPLSLARRMLNLRFSELAKKEDAPFLGAGAGSASAFSVIEGESLSITSSPDRWKDAFKAGEKELRRALRFGFRQAELDEVRADYLRGLDEAVEREPTRSSLSFARQLLSAADQMVVPSNAATVREILKPAIEKVTPEECRQAFRRYWQQDAGTETMTVLGNLDLGPQAPQVLKDLLNESRQQEVEAPPDIRVDAFAYASSEERQGQVVSRRHIEDLDVHLLRFANDVRVNIKKTDFKERQVLIRVRLGEGLLTLDPSEIELGLVAGQVFVGSGLEAHSADELRRLTAGKQVAVTFSPQSRSFILSGATTPDDLLLQCELTAAYLTHPGWRPEALRQFKTVIPRIFEGLKHQHGGAISVRYLPALYDNDPRFGLPSQEKLEAVEMSRLKDWLTPYLSQAPLEITLIGDLDIDAAVEAVSRTFGTLPQRRPLQSFEERRKAPKPKSGVRESYSVDTKVEKTLVYVTFPTTDGIEAQIRRRLFYLARVVDDRLRVEVREKLGAAYSPSASSQTDQTYPGVGLLTISGMAEPDKADALKKAFLAVTDALVKDGVTQEEVERLRPPLLAQLRDGRRSNGFWLQNLDQSQSKPATLESYRALIPFYESVQAEQLTELARRYLASERASWALVSASSGSD